ncbi:hypothetical protein [Magnetofaba australis]|uniref:hypothetical protein n=1 Tax=Magnetofaba australis TaxID=1472297 RepID=UPI0011804750|nr:hypothetical protein [Magnetofaba australis]
MPEVLAALCADNIEDFPALRIHQGHPWHAFLAQLATLALLAAGRDDLPTTADEWRELLRGLTLGFPDDEPWTLAVADLAKPAFLQPPMPGEKPEGFKNQLRAADALDILVTAKSHDVKQATIIHPQPQHWIFSLITLQTFQGFLGAGNYGVARMNGGFASRPGVGYQPMRRWGAAFMRDVTQLLKQDVAPTASKHPPLLWLLPWSGEKGGALPLHELPPLFIEICRRVRLRPEEDAYVAAMGTSKAARIVTPDDYLGVADDPWTPLNHGKKGISALNVSERGWRYDAAQQVLFDSSKVEKAPLQRTQKGEAGAQGGYLLRALTRGQGRTDGYHERWIPCPAEIAASLGSTSAASERLRTLSTAMVEDAGTAIGKVLRPALLALGQSYPLDPTGKLSLDYQDNMPEPWCNRLRDRVDGEFFPFLWESVAQEDAAQDEEARLLWQGRLIGWGLEILELAFARTAVRNARYFKVTAKAKGIYNSCAHKQFANYYETKRMHNAQSEQVAVGETHE